MKLAERITVDPDICHGKPCIRGLRYPVETILELLSSGMTTDEILADYEDLEREDILADFSFAARLGVVKRIEPTPHGVSRWRPTSAPSGSAASRGGARSSSYARSAARQPHDRRPH